MLTLFELDCIEGGQLKKLYRWGFSMSKQKGARYERKAALLLKDVFPDVRRNFYGQAQSGGVDLENTGPFNVEVKSGKAYVSRMIRDVLDQVAGEGKKENWDLCMMFPHREKPYIMMPMDDFLELLAIAKKEGIL